MKKTVIALALTAAVCCQAQNLVQNGDFQTLDEKGKLAGWYYKTAEYSQVPSDRPGETGKKVITTKVKLPTDGKTIRASTNLSQRIRDVKPGKYVVAVTAKVDAVHYCCIGRIVILGPLQRVIDRVVLNVISIPPASLSHRTTSQLSMARPSERTLIS